MLGKSTRVLLLVALATLSLAGSAQARQVQQYFYSGTSFEAGGSNPSAIAFDGADQTLLVVGNGDKEHGLKISKFHPNGDLAGFSGRSGATSFNTGEKLAGESAVAIAVDESGTATSGNFYVASRDAGEVYGYAPDGAPLPGFPLSTQGACGLAVAPDGNLWVASDQLGSYGEFTTSGAPTGRILYVGASVADLLGAGVCRIAIDPAGNFYVAKGERMLKYDSARHLVGDLGPGELGPFSERGSPLLAFDRGDETLFELSSSGTSPVTQVDPSGNPITSFGGADPAHFSYGGLGATRDLAVNPQTHNVYVLKGAGEVNVFARDPSMVTVPNVSVEGVEGLSGTGATLTGSVDPDGVDTTDCHFEWGLGTGYPETAPCAQGNVLDGGSGPDRVTAAIGGLQKGATYHFRLVSKNANGIAAFSADGEFSAADPPALGEASVDHVSSDAARIDLEVNPNGETTKYHVEIGTDTSYGTSFPVPDASLERTRRVGQEGIEVILSPQAETQEVTGLKPATEYHYRVVAENAAGVVEGADHTFKTFALPLSGEEACPNAQARQQTSAAGLLDCRAYELVSAADTGGYDVRSGLVPGSAPLSTSPSAPDAALYSMQSGTIPGIAGNPTNRGADPYLATRGSDGWSTRYLGIPSNDPFAAGPFASPLLAFSSSLSAFAFGGPEICAPCFEDGSTNIPLRTGEGSLAQGMAGSLAPEEIPLPSGTVRAPFSADGSHFVFGSKSQFEPDANESGADATLYERDLNAGTTQVISKLPTGETIQAGTGLAELGISSDGSRVVIGQLVSTDAAGNHYYHLYMHLGNDPETVDLTPGATGGAIYDGMSADGSIVYFTTKDALTTQSEQDTDTSADIYRADIEGESATLTRVSTGSDPTAGNSDSCDPAADSFGAHWNVISGGPADCSVAAIAAGGGVGAQSGAIYFLSPERLDGEGGTQDAPNLYLAMPGQAPKLVTTLESRLTGADPLPTQHPFAKTFAVSSSPQSMAVDQSTGDLYVIATAAGTVRRFDKEGNPANFTAGPNAGTNTLTGFTFGSGGQAETAQVAVDNSGTVTDGDVYVTDNSAAEPVVKVFSKTGAALGQLVGTNTPEGRFGTNTGALQYPTGVAVSPSGTLYVAGGNSGKVYRYTPSANPVSESDYDATLNYGDATHIAGALAAGSNGALYASRLEANGSLVNGVSRYEANQFGAAGAQAGTPIDENATATYVDPKSSRLYTDRGNAFAEYLPSGALVGVSGQGKVSESRGIAVLGSSDGASSRVYASVGGNKVAVFDTLPAASPLVDSPLVVHAVNASDTPRSADFQTTASGNDAVFTSTIPLTGFDAGAGKEEIFRYDDAAGIDCVSCGVTGARPPGDAALSAYGSNLTDDGRVFFTSAEPLTLRDSNEKDDAYEWEDGIQQLISTGTSPSDSELLSVSSDGRNAFFFTRQKLVPEDENGANVRLYTAREDGGFAFGPPQFQCAASDECHGASTTPAPPLAAGTTAGAPGQFQAEAPSKCRKGKVKRKGKCAARHPHKRHSHKRAAKTTRGGGK